MALTVLTNVNSVVTNYQISATVNIKTVSQKLHDTLLLNAKYYIN